MKTTGQISNELNKICEAADAASPYILSTYVTGIQLSGYPKYGIYRDGFVTFAIPFKDEKGYLKFAETTLKIQVRAKGGLNYYYAYKLYLPEPDPFMGNGDCDILAGRAREQFYDNMRCAADQLKKRGTIASYKY